LVLDEAVGKIYLMWQSQEVVYDSDFQGKRTLKCFLW
jgi:hypothetical protein